MYRPSQLVVADVTKRYGAQLVLDRVVFTVKSGEKVGVVGDNGSGKSTLLRLLARVEMPDNGEVIVDSPDGIGYLPQQIDLPDRRTVADAINLALADLRRIEEAMRATERVLASGDGAAAEQYAELLQRFESREGWDADLRVEVACAHLGIGGIDRDRRLGTLSGGERSRLMLAATLASRPALLLLDEPSNDLDDAAVTWLEAQLRDWPGTVVAITHDRAFLDALTDTIIEVADRKVHRYGNGYEGYLTAKAVERRQAAEAYERWRTEVDRQRQIAEANAGNMAAIPRKVPVSRLAPVRSSARGASSRIKIAKRRLELLHRNPVRPPAKPLQFRADLATSGAAAAMVLREVRVGERLHVPELVVAHGERILITGPNGAGKTTLLRVIAGELELETGAIEHSGNAGHLRQHAAPDHDRRSVLRAFAADRIGTLEEHAEALWRLGLFEAEHFGRPVHDLSWGQRRRLELARLVTEPVDLLLLDEPTNHLSPMLAEDLQVALDDYDGTVILVTHDRRLRESFQGRLLTMEAGTITGGR
ncbi:ABC-F family ATP-binding cassette domain-containing protein [Glycomyces luteolus]|uniref:ABC-F family ATP-binding cassette domain-containing protein n=1 Tax=Glycomyces luteolus TaxID=2670330 RepID=A0A9X3PGE5_9ACTN|nr:ABC-F family ATP-binding cassette domain-containing protein [Glycomyces luteolus]MDA1362970.1 ABC-F family ATP-binding cassette domain-containing protein [Glycomyces luteolus]